MPNIAIALKAEISRIARKEIRTETEALKKSVAGYRHEIATLKKRIASLERQGKRPARAQPIAATSSQGESRRLRFSAARLAAQRSKLGLSAADFAALLGVSALSVYKWEKGETRPRAAQLEAIAEARGVGKREAQARLEQLKAA
jgi:DNA-binding transcriptional regulator YiaG